MKIKRTHKNRRANLQPKERKQTYKHINLQQHIHITFFYHPNWTENIVQLRHFWTMDHWLMKRQGGHNNKNRNIDNKELAPNYSPKSSFFRSLALRAASSCCSKEPGLPTLLPPNWFIVEWGSWLSLALPTLRKNVPLGHRTYTRLNTSYTIYEFLTFLFTTSSRESHEDLELWKQKIKKM